MKTADQIRALEVELQSRFNTSNSGSVWAPAIRELALDIYQALEDVKSSGDVDAALKGIIGDRK